jgi:hypothetical protein
MVDLKKVEIVFILFAWVFVIFSWYFGYQVYAATRGKSRFYIYFFFGGLSVGMLLVFHIFTTLGLYEINDCLFAYDFFLMASAFLMMLGFREMNRSLKEQME